MKDIFADYIASISRKFSHEETSEMGYRTDLEILINKIFAEIKVKRIDHDPKAKKGNKPDFVLLTCDVPILYIETKNIGVSLDKIESSKQMVRYYGYANLVLTDYVEFRFYRNGIPYEKPIKIAEYDLKKRNIFSYPENYDLLSRTLVDFTKSHKEPIQSGEHLAKIMAGKAQRIRDNVRFFLSNPSEKNAAIMKIYDTIKSLLVHDLTNTSFADMYAQTLVYGLFVARYHDKTPDNFSRQEARDLVPASNPLLRHFFDHIVGADFDKRLEFIVNELCVVFSHSNVQELMKQYFADDLWGKTHEEPDPVIHFYEDFLREYDPKLRKKMGAYYTPLPIVRFIVRSVDYLLGRAFDLDSGLADTSRMPNDVHRVHILDPAAGTGTFISATIRLIYERLRKSGQKGRWPKYVHHDLLPRLHGFELMMAPYTIAHLKLSMAFKATGFWNFHRRLGIYLTNSLEESSIMNDLFTGFGFAESIAVESKEASVIKNDTPIMVIIGNPPYSAASSNETKYANSLVEKYKFEPKSQKRLQERKHWLNDDYVKFVAFAEKMIVKNRDGILGFITNHGYIDNPTFRGMRWHLLDTFDTIYIIDLHGNAKKKEITPNGSKDENVFGIQPGVAIMLAVKDGKKKKGDLAEIQHTDIWGKKVDKFMQLNDATLENIQWEHIKPTPPNYYFVSEGSAVLKDKYHKGFCVRDLFTESTTGVFTLGDGFIVDNDKNTLGKRIENFLFEDISEEALKEKYKLGKNYAKWIIGNKNKIRYKKDKIVAITYRPFDNRYTYFDNKLIWRPRTKLMSNFLRGPNIGLAVGRQGKVVGSMVWNVVFVTSNIIDLNCFYRGGEQVFPLYLYSINGIKVPNFNLKLIDEIEKKVGKFPPDALLHYIYAVLHSPSYRKKYGEFLRSDFPFIPYPNDRRMFNKLIMYGSELCALHLLESPTVNHFITTYPVAGSDKVEKCIYKDNGVYINDKQYFGNVSKSVWNFYIGGYQPAQKWLKDRKNGILTNRDIEHYQSIIVSLTETLRIMGEIDGCKLM